MSASDFLTGEIANSHLQDAAPSWIHAIKRPLDKVVPSPCDTWATGNCYPTAAPGGPCDIEWVKKNLPPPPHFIKSNGKPPWHWLPESPEWKKIFPRR